MEKEDTITDQQTQQEVDDEFDYYYNSTLKINTKHGRLEYIYYLFIKILFINYFPHLNVLLKITKNYPFLKK